jgi:hypothetical protein
MHSLQGLQRGGGIWQVLRIPTALLIVMLRWRTAGLDYTVAHYGMLTKDPRLDCVLTFVDDTTPEAAAGWEVGEVGGFEAYLLADEEETSAAEVYRQVGGAGLTTWCHGRCTATMCVAAGLTNEEQG